MSGNIPIFKNILGFEDIPKIFKPERIKEYNVLDCSDISIFSTGKSYELVSYTKELPIDIFQAGVRVNEVAKNVLHASDMLYLTFDTEYTTNEDTGIREIVCYQITSKYNGIIHSRIFLLDEHANENNDNRLKFNFIMSYYSKLYKLDKVDSKNVFFDDYYNKSYYVPDELRVLSKTDFNLIYKAFKIRRRGLRYSDGRNVELFNNIKKVIKSKNLTEYLNDATFKLLNEVVPVKPVKVSLMAHSFVADIKTLYDFDDFKGNLTQTNGIVALDHYNILRSDLLYKSKANVWKIKFLDSKCLFDTTLEKIGDSMGIEKLSESFNNHNLDITQMDITLKNQTLTTLKYACRDTEILMNMLNICYPDMNIPSTNGAYFTKLAKMYMFDISEDIDNFKDYNTQLLEWRGFKKVTKKRYTEDGRFYNVEHVIVPDGLIATKLENLSRVTYLGGANMSIEQGYYNNITFDYDLKNCYPTAGCLLYDIDYQSNEFLGTFIDQKMTRTQTQMFNYNTIGMGYVEFDFTKSTRDIKFPCIAIPADGGHGLVFPLKGEAWTDWVSVKLAIEMGAEINAREFHFFAPKRDENDNIKHSLSRAMIPFVNERTLMVEDYGKKSIQELQMKNAVNSGYGKIGQAVKDKRLRDISTMEMKDIPESVMTNGVYAVYMTAFPRAILNAVMQQSHELGYKAYSCTTDGFIGDIPEHLLHELDLFGLNKIFKQARLVLGDDSGKIWEIKHTQENLLNVTTRVNSGFDDLNSIKVENHNVNAHAGYRGEEDFPIAYLNRKRDGIIVESKEFTSLVNQARGQDFNVKIRTKKYFANYDFKRKVDTKTIEDRSLVSNGVVYKVATYSSIPYLDMEEYESVRGELDKVRFSMLTGNDIIHFLQFDVKKKEKSFKANLTQSVRTLFNEPNMKQVVDIFRKTYGKNEIIKVVSDTLTALGFEDFTDIFTEKNYRNVIRNDRYKNVNDNEQSMFFTKAYLDTLMEIDKANNFIDKFDYANNEIIKYYGNNISEITFTDEVSTLEEIQKEQEYFKSQRDIMKQQHFNLEID